MRNGAIWDLMGEGVGRYRDFAQNTRDLPSTLRWIIMWMRYGRLGSLRKQ